MDIQLSPEQKRKDALAQAFLALMIAKTTCDNPAVHTWADNWIAGTERWIDQYPLGMEHYDPEDRPYGIVQMAFSATNHYTWSQHSMLQFEEDGWYKILHKHMRNLIAQAEGRGTFNLVELSQKAIELVDRDDSK